jgi:hypothetical protein
MALVENARQVQTEMPDYPYFPNPNVWEPMQMAEGARRTPQFWQILLPSTRTQIIDYTDYQFLLADKVEWLIYHYSWQLEIPLIEVFDYLAIKSKGLDVSLRPERVTSARGWAKILTEHSWLSEMWELDIPIEQGEFPLQILQDEEEKKQVVEGIQEGMNLEQWLMEMVVE